MNEVRVLTAVPYFRAKIAELRAVDPSRCIEGVRGEQICILIVDSLAIFLVWTHFWGLDTLVWASRTRYVRHVIISDGQKLFILLTCNSYDIHIISRHQPH